MDEHNILLSYPRSGNHLTRFFIELLSERPTSSYDKISLYETKYFKEIPFNIKKGSQDYIYRKEHFVIHKDSKNVIFLLRNPKEVLLRHYGFQYNEKSFDKYFNNIKQYLEFKGNKKLFFYEDILTNKEQFINELYKFLECDKVDKLKYVLNNLDELWSLSLGMKYTTQHIQRGVYWGGNKSKQCLNYYYKQTKKYNKTQFDNYLREKLKDPDFNFLIDKYGNI